MNDNVLNAEGLLAFERSVQEQVKFWSFCCWRYCGRATLQHTIWIGPGS